MTEGHISPEGYLLVTLQVADTNQIWHEVEVAIDTGFSGAMTLPVSSIKQWSLSFIERLEFTLGDGSDVEFNTYSTRVIFAGQERSISVLEIDSNPPLIGFKLLKGFHVGADMIEGGKVIVKPLDIGT